MADLPAALVRTGVLSPDAAARALAAAQDGDVASAALRLGLAAEAVLVRALCDVHGCPGVDLSKSVVPTANLDVVAPAFCRQRRVLPVSVGKSEMVVAMADPEDYTLADELRFVTGRRVLRYAAVPAALDRVLDGLVRERARGAAAWRGAQAPQLPDPGAAWVGVVHPTRKVPEGIDELPEATGTMEIVGLAESVVDDPFAQPTPARRARAPELAPPPVEVPDDPLGTKTVRITGLGAGRVALVADASAESRDDLAASLGKLGCTVLQAANGKAALDVIREARPDVVFLEALLPVVPGFEVCRAVKGDPVLRPTRVVLTSGTHRGTVLSDAQIAFGADAALEKPYRPDDVQRVAKLLLIGAAATTADPGEKERRDAAAAAWRAGAAALQAGHVEVALERLRDAVAQDDLSAEAQYYLGVALSRSGMLFEAAAAFGRAAELRPDVDAAHQLLAQTYEQLGFQKSAREAWARAIETCRDEPRKKAMQTRLMALLGL